MSKHYPNLKLYQYTEVRTSMNFERRLLKRALQYYPHPDRKELGGRTDSTIKSDSAPFHWHCHILFIRSRATRREILNSSLRVSHSSI